MGYFISGILRFMSIRKARHRDIPFLVALDRSAYGDYGADKRYFQQKISSPHAKVFVAESDGHVSGFVVFEGMEPGQQLAGFSDLNITQTITKKWMHIIAFTTITNFKEVQADSELLQAAENEAESLGCALFCVPLSIDHPYLKNDVFGFWEKNGYRKIGTIKWLASPTETIDCYFYTKPANNTN